MIEVIGNKYNKENTINSKSQCYSSSNKQNKQSVLATILDNNTTTNIVADSAATGHFFPNENNRKNDPNQIEV